jgi:hypothetical protein
LGSACSSSTSDSLELGLAPCLSEDQSAAHDDPSFFFCFFFVGDG